MATTVTAAGLDLTQPGTYEVLDGEALTAGAVTWRRTVAQSPFVHGEIEIHAVRDTSRGRMTVDVQGANAAAVATNLTSLINAVTAASWTLTVDVDGTSYTWTCSRADYTPPDVSGLWDPLQGQPVVRVTFEFPRHPIAVAGPI